VAVGRYTAWRHPELWGGAGIQNGGVDRMSEMSSILRIPLYRDAFSPNEAK